VKSMKNLSTSWVVFLLNFLLVPAFWAANFNVSDVTEFQNALTTATDNGENDTIVVAAGTYNVVTTLTFWSLEDYSLTIIGAGIGSTILDGGNTTKALNIEANGTTDDISVKNIRFSNGNSVYGAGLYISTDVSDIDVDNCEFTDNYVSGLGVGAGANCYSNAGDVSVSNCFFRRNDSYTEVIPGEWPEAGGRCGGLFVQIAAEGSGAQITLRNSYFEDNAAAVDAGAAMLYPLSSDAIIIAEGNTFVNNQANNAGGGLWLRLPNINTSVQVNNNSFTGNSTIDSTLILGAGGLYIEINAGTLDLYENTFDSNDVDEDGGAAWITLESGTIDFTSSTFFNNSADNNGGAVSIFINEGTLNFSRNILYSNESANIGGALNLATGHATLNVFNNTFYDNVAPEGSGIYFYFDEITSAANVFNNILWQNTAPVIAYSGAITATVQYSDIEGGTGEPWFGTGCIDVYPLFADTAGGDFHLTWVNFPIEDATKSPCIDSGDPVSPYDSDATIADMGALPFDQSTKVWNENISIPAFFISSAPNPFNSVCVITAPGNAEIKIYDLRGKLVATPINIQAQQGIVEDKESCAMKSAHWRWCPDESIASGIYLVRARINDGNCVTKRVMYLR